MKELENLAKLVLNPTKSKITDDRYSLNSSVSVYILNTYLEHQILNFSDLFKSLSFEDLSTKSKTYEETDLNNIGQPLWLYWIKKSDESHNAVKFFIDICRKNNYDFSSLSSVDQNEFPDLYYLIKYISKETLDDVLIHLTKEQKKQLEKKMDIFCLLNNRISSDNLYVFIQHGWDVNIYNAEQEHLLEKVTIWDNAKILLENGSNPLFTSKNGKTITSCIEKWSRSTQENIIPIVTKFIANFQKNNSNEDKTCLKIQNEIINILSCQKLTKVDNLLNKLVLYPNEGKELIDYSNQPMIDIVLKNLEHKIKSNYTFDYKDYIFYHGFFNKINVFHKQDGWIDFEKPFKDTTRKKYYTFLLSHMYFKNNRLHKFLKTSDIKTLESSFEEFSLSDYKALFKDTYFLNLILKDLPKKSKNLTFFSIYENVFTQIDIHDSIFTPLIKKCIEQADSYLNCQNLNELNAKIKEFKYHDFSYMFNFLQNHHYENKTHLDKLHVLNLIHMCLTSEYIFLTQEEEDLQKNYFQKQIFNVINYQKNTVYHKFFTIIQMIKESHQQDSINILSDFFNKSTSENLLHIFENKMTLYLSLNNNTYTEKIKNINKI